MPIDPTTSNLGSERDITKYGASIVRTAVAYGTKYWKIIDAYHLSGQQNRGNHNLFADVLNAGGTRRMGAHCTVYFAGHTALLTIDKPPNEPGANAPMYRANFYDIEASDLPSDKAMHFNTEWPDEEEGNTNGHHSFMVVFEETIAGDATTSSIRGTVTNGAGMTVTLSGAGVNVSTQAAADGSFGFDLVPPGDYTVAVAGTAVTAAVSVQAGQQASVTLLVPANPDIEALKRQIAVLQAQVAQLQQQLAQAASDRDRYGAALGQVKQIVQNLGL
jgi:hypothetical protein